MRILFLFVSINTILSCSRNCDNDFTKNGIDLNYYQNQKLKSRIEVKNCVCFGIASYYHPNGKLQSTGRCIKGKYDGNWNFYDQNGNPIAQARWNMGRFVSYKILLKNGDSINFNNQSKSLYNKQGKEISDSKIIEIFNTSIETEIINDRLIAIKDYRNLAILTPQL